MAKNRIVNTKFWTDSFVINELNPVEKLVFIYLITNPYTDICGIYELPIKIMAVETGIDRDNLEKVILPRLEQAGKMLYRNGWVAIKNFIKHQAVNPNVKKGICEGLLRAPVELKDFIEGKPLKAFESLSHTDSTQTLLNTDLIGGDAAKASSNLLVNYFFELKGWANKDKDFYKGNKISYSRHLRPAKELLALCEGNLEEAKHCLKKVADWAMTRDLDWAIETVFKKWYDIDILQPKEKKPYYRGNRVFEITGRKYVLMPNGEKLQFAGKESELTYK